MKGQGPGQKKSILTLYHFTSAAFTSTKNVKILRLQTRKVYSGGVSCVLVGPFIANPLQSNLRVGLHRLATRREGFSEPKAPDSGAQSPRVSGFPGAQVIV
jgi:hypothetical protein